MCVHGGGRAEVGHVRANSPEEVQHCRHKSEPAIKPLKVRSYTSGSGIPAANAARQPIHESPALEGNGLLDGPGDLFRGPCTPRRRPRAAGGQKPASGLAGVPARRAAALPRLWAPLAIAAAQLGE